MNYSKLIEIAKALKPIDWKSHSFHTTFAYYKNHPLAIGINKPHCTHPINLKYNYIDRDGLQRSHKIGLHSEMSAILCLGLEDCRSIDFYIVRINNNGKPDISKPCSGCIHVLKQVGYKNIYFTNRNGEFEKYA